MVVTVADGPYVACPRCGAVGQQNPHFQGGPDAPARCSHCRQETPLREWGEVVPCEQPLLAGVYRHYNGGLYEVFGMATHTETMEVSVIYRIQGGGEYPLQCFWSRPATMFFEVVKPEGEWVPRFRFEGPEDAPQILLVPGWELEG